MREPDDMRALVETLPLVVYTATLDEKGKPLFVAPQVEELLGVAPDEFTFDLLVARIHPDDREKTVERFRQADRNREDLTVEYRWIRPDGRTIWLEDASRVVDVQGRPVAQGYLLDVTQRKETELVLARRTEGRQHLAALGRQSLVGASRDEIVHGALRILRDDVGAEVGAILENAASGLVVVDDFGWQAIGAVAHEGTPAFTANLERRTITGATSLSSNESLLARTGMRSTIAAPIFGEGSEVFGVVAVHSREEDAFDEGQVALVEQVANLIAAVVLRERTDARTQMSQRLEAVGQLAAGVAHDFNNMLTVISGYAGFALNHVDPTGRKQLEHVLHAAERAGALTAQLLAFSRRQTLNRRPVRMGDTVRAVLPMLRTMLGENVTVIEDVGDAVVLADQAQLENMLVNLALNARDAMPRGGTLTIACGSVEIDDLEAEVQEVAPGAFGFLRVSDTGIGMSEAVLARVFEPFFTTKDPGEGTGLGLASVYGTVRQSGGYVDVESEPGVGTTVLVHLPLADPLEPVAPPHAEEELPVVPGRVLLVEDEDIVRALLTEQLEHAGHEVVAAGTAVEALRLLEVRAFDALVTDVGLPGINGATLADSVRTLHPGLGVILISGYPGDLVGASPSLAGVQLLQKPFTSRELQQALASVLG
jgi:PAS domain S-box-containing protein